VRCLGPVCGLRSAEDHRLKGRLRAPRSTRLSTRSLGLLNFASSRNYTSERGGGVRARAHACVALSRCVAFGRPKMSVWGHAGAGSPSSKVACISFLRPLFWNLFDGSVSISDAVGVSTFVCTTTHARRRAHARQRACRRPERCEHVRAHRRRARRRARSRRRASPSPRPSHDC
jgi:hypothetical protein